VKSNLQGRRYHGLRVTSESVSGAHKLQGGTIREFETLEWHDSGTELSNENVGPRVGLQLLL